GGDPPRHAAGRPLSHHHEAACQGEIILTATVPRRHTRTPKPGLLALRRAGADDFGFRLGPVFEFGLDVDLELAADALGTDRVDALDALFDAEVERDDRARATGDLRDLRHRQLEIGAFVDLGDGHRGDDRARDRIREVRVDVPGDLAALFAAVEQQQLRGDVDRFLFGEGDLCRRRAFTDQ